MKEDLHTEDMHISRPRRLGMSPSLAKAAITDWMERCAAVEAHMACRQPDHPSGFGLPRLFYADALFEDIMLRCRPVRTGKDEKRLGIVIARVAVTESSRGKKVFSDLVGWIEERAFAAGLAVEVEQAQPYLGLMLARRGYRPCGHGEGEAFVVTNRPRSWMKPEPVLDLDEDWACVVLPPGVARSLVVGGHFGSTAVAEHIEAAVMTAIATAPAPLLPSIDPDILAPGVSPAALVPFLQRLSARRTVKIAPEAEAPAP